MHTVVALFFQQRKYRWGPEWGLGRAGGQHRSILDMDIDVESKLRLRVCHSEISTKSLGLYPRSARPTGRIWNAYDRVERELACPWQ